MWHSVPSASSCSINSTQNPKPSVSISVYQWFKGAESVEWFNHGCTPMNTDGDRLYKPELQAPKAGMETSGKKKYQC